MIILTQSRLGTHDLISPHDRHSGISKYCNKYWIGYKLNFITWGDVRAMKAGTYIQPFFSYLQYKITLYCMPGKNTDQGDFKGDFWLYYWYDLYTYQENTR